MPLRDRTLTTLRNYNGQWHALKLPEKMLPPDHIFSKAPSEYAGSHRCSSAVRLSWALQNCSSIYVDIVRVKMLPNDIVKISRSRE